MFDMIFYLKLLAGLGFIVAGIDVTYGNKKNPNRYKHGALPGILFLSAGALELLSALAYVLQ